jgi:acyl dehydratase
MVFNGSTENGLKLERVMPIDYQKLINWPLPEVEHRYEVKDTILYALGLGCGSDPLDEEDLRFVYEDGIRVQPAMAVILGYPGFWLKDPAIGVDWKKVVHGEQGLILHKPLPPAATVIGRTKILEVVDKGPGKGALLFSERDVFEKSSGKLFATLTSTTFLRGDGGFGGPSAQASQVQLPPLPDGEPDIAMDTKTLPQTALIYRLSGDWNPLHADPQIAASAGFPRPILHGLCTFGIVSRVLLRAYCRNEQSNLKSMQGRFSAPVFPGETIRTEIWHNGSSLSFRARVLERDTIVITNGVAVLAGKWRSGA